MADYGTWAVSDSGRNEEGDARPKHLDWAQDVQSGRPGWLLAPYASDIVSAEEILDAVRLQKELASADGSRWVSVLDSGDDHGRAYAVFEPQEVALSRLIEMRKIPTPAELAALAIGVVLALEQLKARFGREHGQLAGETVFLRMGEKGPDCSAPRLSELSPASYLGQRRSWNTDPHCLGTLLCQYVKGDADFSVEHRELPDENRLWPEESGKLNRRWRGLIGRLLEGKYNHRPLADLRKELEGLRGAAGFFRSRMESLADLRKDLEGLREKSPLPVVGIAAVALLAVAFFSLKPVSSKPTPHVTNGTGGVASNLIVIVKTNPAYPTNVVAPPPAVLLPGETVVALKAAVRSGQYGALSNAVKELRDAGIINPNQFAVLKGAVTNWWNDTTWKPSLPLNLTNIPRKLRTALESALNPAQPLPVPRVDEEVVGTLEKELNRRDGLKTNISALIGAWKGLEARLQTNSVPTGWAELGLQGPLRSNIAHEFIRYADEKWPSSGLVEGKEFLKQEPKGFFDAVTFPAPPNELVSAFTNQLPSAEQTLWRQKFPADLAGLTNWFSQVSQATNDYLPAFAYSPGNFPFPPSNPTFPEFESRFLAASNSLSRLQSVDIVEIQPQLNGLGTEKGKLEADRATLQKSALEGPARRGTFEVGHGKLVREFGVWETGVSNAVTLAITTLRNRFNETDSQGFPAILRQVEALPASSAQETLKAYVSAGMERLKELRQSLQKGEYGELTPEKFTPYREQTEFKGLLGRADSEKQLLERITRLIDTDWNQANEGFQKLDLALKQKPPFDKIREKLVAKRPVVAAVDLNPPASTTSPPTTVAPPPATDGPADLDPVKVKAQLKEFMAKKDREKPGQGKAAGSAFLENLRGKLGSRANQDDWSKALSEMQGFVNFYKGGI